MKQLKKKLLYAAACMLLLAAWTGGGCTVEEVNDRPNNTEKGKALAAPVEEIDERLIQANNGAGFKLFHELRADKEENIFISPASILTALAMTYNGADGETKEAMEKTLLLQDMTMEEVNKAFADLLTILQNPDPEVEMTVANSLWAREGVDFHSDFLERNEQYFSAEIDVLDFSKDEAADIINNWVKENTGQKITDIVEAPLSEDAVLFLINAIYFKGAWTEPFDPDLTREIPFTLPDGSEKEHPLMFQGGDFQAMQNDLFQAVSLPYGKNERISMYVFLPAREKGLEEFYAALNEENWNNWRASFTEINGDIGIPRFKFAYESSLTDALKALGMEIAFDEDHADFSKMRPIPPRLFISEVKHKTYIDVNEEGTEAAAATSVEIGVTSMPERFTMYVDRPFFFAIADDMTGTILFMGSVYEPL